MIEHFDFTLLTVENIYTYSIKSKNCSKISFYELFLQSEITEDKIYLVNKYNFQLLFLNAL